MVIFYGERKTIIISSTQKMLQNKEEKLRIRNKEEKLRRRTRVEGNF